MPFIRKKSELKVEIVMSLLALIAGIELFTKFFFGHLISATLDTYPNKTVSSMGLILLLGGLISLWMIFCKKIGNIFKNTGLIIGSGFQSVGWLVVALLVFSSVPQTLLFLQVSMCLSILCGISLYNFLLIQRKAARGEKFVRIK